MVAATAPWPPRAPPVQQRAETHPAHTRFAGDRGHHHRASGRPGIPQAVTPSPLFPRRAGTTRLRQSPPGGYPANRPPGHARTRFKGRPPGAPVKGALQALQRPCAGRETRWDRPPGPSPPFPPVLRPNRPARCGCPAVPAHGHSAAAGRKAIPATPSHTGPPQPYKAPRRQHDPPAPMTPGCHPHRSARPHPHRQRPPANPLPPNTPPRPRSQTESPRPDLPPIRRRHDQRSNAPRRVMPCRVRSRRNSHTAITETDSGPPRRKATRTPDGTPS